MDANVTQMLLDHKTKAEVTTKPVTVILKIEQAKQLEALSNQFDVSVADLVRLALNKTYDIK